jgi:hypothetical protein
MLEKVISGCQTGADRAGLIAAQNCDLQTGGYVLRNNKTELGEEPELIPLYGLTETKSSSYPTRTLQNVNAADATWIFYKGKLERGSLLTKKYCDQLHKKCMTLDISYVPGPKNKLTNEEYLINWLKEVKPSILNIAGNRESVAPGIQQYVTELLEKVFDEQKN